MHGKKKKEGVEEILKRKNFIIEMRREYNWGTPELTKKNPRSTKSLLLVAEGTLLSQRVVTSRTTTFSAA